METYTAAQTVFTERDFALYELIIVKNKGKNTVKATAAIDKKNLQDDGPGKTWREYGLPDPKVS